jgi:hypothetical protein
VGVGQTRQSERMGGGSAVCEGEGDAFSAGGDDINTVTAVVGEGRAKVVSAVSVRVPREVVVGAVERET